MINVDGRTHLEDDDFESELTDMKIGDFGWIVPWAVSADADGILYLRLEWTYSKIPGGTVDTLVIRRGEDEWQVLFTARQKFTPKNDPNPHWKVSYNVNAQVYGASLVRNHMDNVDEKKFEHECPNCHHQF